MRLRFPIQRMPRRWRGALSCLLIAVGAATAARFLPDCISPLQSAVIKLDAGAYDGLFARRPPEPPIPQVVIIQINKNTIQNVLDLYHDRYPFPRTLYARLIRILNQDCASAIGIDIVMATPSANPRDDAELADALRAAGNVILAADFTAASTESVDQTSSAQDVPTAPLRKAALAFSPVDIPLDFDTSARRFDLLERHLSLTDVRRTEEFPDFGVRIAAAYRGISEKKLLADLHRGRFDGRIIPRAPDTWESYRPGRTVRICFTRPPGASCQYVSLDQVLSGEVAASTFRNKVVLVGSTDLVEQDFRRTPLCAENGADRPGVEVHANIIHTLLAGHYYASAPEALRIGLILMLSVLAAAVTYWLRPTRALAAIGLIIAALAGTESALFRARCFMRPTELVAAIILAYVGCTIFLYLTEEKKARHARKTFGRFVGPRVLEKVLDESYVPLTGEVRHVAVMFTDLEGFTSLSERMDPQAALAVLNRYLNRMVECIYKHDGTLDKFMGDGIMVYFGAPQRMPNPELSAVRCALEMQMVMREWRRAGEEEGLPPLRMRIGIHAGEVIAGEAGSAQQIGYTVIGDVVNVAARLEPLNKTYQTEILISDEIKQGIPPEMQQLYLKEEGDAPIRGREEAIHVYSVRDPLQQ